ncbi:hypothetical protein [Streptomyces cyaneofuscatus]|uniref:hypothetical protein n=1 Tax=Streptomyces cyaneofuscatus TaxID=66883 RepID=UPI0033AD4B6B
MRVAVTGAAYVTAPKFHTTDSASGWGAAFTDIGCISDDGIAESNSTDATEIKGVAGRPDRPQGHQFV